MINVATVRSNRRAVLAVFRQLRQWGLCAEPKYADCLSCGVRSIHEAPSQRSIGYVFWHIQDEDALWVTGELYLAYGALSDDVEDSAIAKQVVDALTATGLAVAWDGDPGSRILVRLNEPRSYRPKTRRSIRLLKADRAFLKRAGIKY